MRRLYAVIIALALMVAASATAWSIGALRINLEAVKNPRMLSILLSQFDKQIDSLTVSETTADYIFSDPNITRTAGSTTTVTYDNMYYVINGCLYYKATSNVTMAGSTVPQNTYGAFALQVGTDGTIDVVAATANATGYASGALAIAGLPAVAANHARMGYFTVIRTDGTYIPGSTNMDTSNLTKSYTDLTAAAQIETDKIARGK